MDSKNEQIQLDFLLFGNYYGNAAVTATSSTLVDNPTVQSETQSDEQAIEQSDEQVTEQPDEQPDEQATEQLETVYASIIDASIIDTAAAATPLGYDNVTNVIQQDQPQQEQQQQQIQQQQIHSNSALTNVQLVYPIPLVPSHRYNPYGRTRYYFNQQQEYVPEHQFVCDINIPIATPEYLQFNSCETNYYDEHNSYVDYESDEETITAFL